MTGMPGASDVSDKVGWLATEIADMEREAEAVKRGMACELMKLEGIINSLPDPITRTVFRLRFVLLCSWQEVAREMGGKNTPYGVKMMVIRQLSKI